MKTLHHILLICICFGLVSSGTSQSRIDFLNPSFEKYGVGTNNKIEGWNSCLYADYSPPDIHTHGSMKWNNSLQPFSGSSYLGLVVRPDSTGENISQRLVAPLRENRFYTFQIHLAKPKTYESRIRMSGDSKLTEELSENYVNFNQPVKLQVWGFKDKCEPGSILFETIPIDHTEWKSYSISFSPKDDYTHLAFIPVYNKKQAYAGCVLIDECSPIFETDSQFEYSYEEPDYDALFLQYEKKYNPEIDKIERRGAFITYYPLGNLKNYWFYDFSNPNFYSKRFLEITSYRPRITEYRYAYDNTLTDKVVFYENTYHTSYYQDSKIASIKNYLHGNLEGKQKLYWPSGNVMMEYEMSMEKKYQRRDVDNTLIFSFTQRVKHIYMAPRDGVKLEKFRIPKDSDLGDLAINSEKELILYNTKGGMMGKMRLDDSSFDTNQLLRILRK